MPQRVFPVPTTAKTVIQPWVSLPDRYNLKIAYSGPEYWHNVLTSVFCLATSGTGWGSRFKVRRWTTAHCQGAWGQLHET